MIGNPVPGDAEPRWQWPRAAYIHIPFCAHKCGYCDFASLAGVDHLADRYLAALDRELARGVREGLPHHTDRQDPDRDHRHHDEDGEEQDDPTGALQP